MARLGPRFGPPKSPENVYVYVPLLRSFPGNEAHKLFSGGPKSGVLGEGQKVYVENFYVLFPSLIRELEEDSNFSVFRVRQFSEWPEPLH